jgi:type IV secretory pathway TrbL component
VSAVDAPASIPPLYWLLAVVFPALCTVVVALITRPVKRAARAAEANSAQAATNAHAAATSAAHAATELTPNHGSSTKDQATRMELKLDELATELASVKATGTATSKDIGGMREELRTERRERLALADRFDEHVRTASS